MEPTAIAAAASSAFTLSGPAASGAITGIRPASSDRERASGARDGHGLADEAELRHLRRAQADVVAEVAARRAGRAPTQSSSLTAASDARTTSIPSGVVTRRPPTNSTGMPARSISSADLRAGAVDDAHLVLARELEHGRGRLRRDRAADLDDDPAHER